MRRFNNFYILNSYKVELINKNKNSHKVTEQFPLACNFKLRYLCIWVFGYAKLFPVTLFVPVLVQTFKDWDMDNLTVISSSVTASNAQSFYDDNCINLYQSYRSNYKN